MPHAPSLRGGVTLMSSLTLRALGQRILTAPKSSISYEAIGDVTSRLSERVRVLGANLSEKRQPDHYALEFLAAQVLAVVALALGKVVVNDVDWTSLLSGAVAGGGAAVALSGLLALATLHRQR